MFICIYIIFLLIIVLNSVNGYGHCDVGLFLRTTIENEGFHRVIKTDLVVESSLSKKLNSLDCYVALHQILPGSVYVDKEQLNELSNTKQSWLDKYHLNETIDVEAPAEISPSINVFILRNQVVEPVADGNVDDLVVTSLKLPIHLRYHAPQSHSRDSHSATVNINRPTLLVRCNADDGPLNMPLPTGCLQLFQYSLPCNRIQSQTKDNNFYDQTVYCNDWWQLATNQTYAEEEISVDVPVGNLDRTFVVQFVTLWVTNFGAAYVVYHLLFKHQKIISIN